MRTLIIILILQLGYATNAQVYWDTQGNVTTNTDFIGTKNGNPLIIKTSATITGLPEERLRITENGDFGFGTIAPFSLWPSGRVSEIKGDNPVIRLSNQSSAASFYLQSNSGFNAIYSNVPLRMYIDSSTSFSIVRNENVAGGNDTTLYEKLLTLNSSGNLFVRGIKVTVDSFPDYVFNKNYNLITLDSLRTFINQEGHLPDVPTADVAIREGIDLGKNQEILLRKIEELTLYVLLLEEKISELSRLSVGSKE